MKAFIYKHSKTLSLLWAMIIFGLCATPGQYIPVVSWLEYLSFDKWVHASVFFVLVFLLLLVTHKSSRGKAGIFLVVSGAIFYGGLLEVMQAKLFSERMGDWPDFFANTFGCLISLLVFPKLRKKFSGLPASKT